MNINTIHNNICTQFDTIKKILTKLSAHDKLAELNSLEMSYIESIVIINQHSLVKSDIAKQILYGNYIRFINSLNINSIVAKMVDYIKRFGKFTKEINLIESLQTDSLYEEYKNEQCRFCLVDYQVDEVNNELICVSCGNVERLISSTTEEDGIFQNTIKTKSSKYFPQKHSKSWEAKILGRENIDIPQSLLDNIKKAIVKDKLWLEQITCEDIRYYLKKFKQTAYNSDATLIMTLITKISVPDLTEHEHSLLKVYRNRVIDIFNKIKPEERMSSPYHPYWNYKIIEQILNKPCDKKRREKILSYIHHPSRETIVEYDRIWFDICNYVPEFTKIPTESR